MGSEDLKRELDELRQRVERIERRLASGAPAAPPSTPPVPATAVPPPAPVVAAVPSPAAPVAPPTAPPAARPPAARTPAAAPPTAPVPLPAAARVAPPARPRARRAAPDRSRSPLELLIGGKVAAWVGAIVIVVAAGLLVQLGIEAGWWGRLSATARCLLIAGFGGALLLGGEVALRRISRPASVGLFGAGLGVLYLDAFATFRFFELVSREWAFVLLALVAAVGFACTLRTSFRTIGVLSLLGGYLTPMLLAGAGGHDLELLAFLTALLGVGLALSAVRPVPFRPLRFVAMGAHAFVALVWLVTQGPGLWLAAVIFLSIWWSMTLAESTLAALRGQTARSNALATLLATAAYVTAGCWVLGTGATGPGGGAGPDWLGTFTAAIAVLGAAVALQFGPGVEALRRRPRTPIDVLAVALWAQSGVLLAVAVALQFDGFAQGVSWLAIAVASIEIGRRLPSRGVDVFGLVVLGLSLLYVLVTGAAIAAGLGALDLGDELWSAGPLVVNRWSLVALLAVVLLLVAAFRLRVGPSRAWRPVPVLLTALAAFGWVALTAAQAEGLLATTLWLAGAAALLATNRHGARLRFFDVGLVVLVLAGTRWLLFDALAPRVGPEWDPLATLPLINGQAALAVAIAACAVWATRIAGARTTDASGVPGTLVAWGPVAAALVLLVGATFEIDRAVSRLAPEQLESLAFAPALVRSLWWTGAWAAGGLAMILVGRAARLPRLLGSGWAVLLLSAVVWLAGDTLAWRVIEGHDDATVVLNLQFAVGAVLLGLSGLVVRLLSHRDAATAATEGWPPHARATALGVIATLGLWLGSFEIDRGLAEGQAGLSVYWALYGTGLVVVGFARRTAAARYAGLALLAVTVAKVLVIDLATLDRMWRVASFLVSGILLVGTSVLYTRLSPRLLAAEPREEGEAIRPPGAPSISDGRVIRHVR